jgi:hypothetical protein
MVDIRQTGRPYPRPTAIVQAAQVDHAKFAVHQTGTGQPSPLDTQIVGTNVLVDILRYRIGISASVDSALLIEKLERHGQCPSGPLNHGFSYKTMHDGLSLVVGMARPGTRQADRCRSRESAFYDWLWRTSELSKKLIISIFNPNVNWFI